MAYRDKNTMRLTGFRFRNYEFSTKADTDHFVYTTVKDYLDGSAQYLIYTYKNGVYKGFVQFKTCHDPKILEDYLLQKDKIEFSICKDPHKKIKSILNMCEGIPPIKMKYHEEGTYIVPMKVGVLIPKSESYVLPNQSTIGSNGKLDFSKVSSTKKVDVYHPEKYDRNLDEIQPVFHRNDRRVIMKNQKRLRGPVFYDPVKRKWDKIKK